MENAVLLELLLSYGYLLVGAGLVAGFVAGLLGVGGGFVTIPVLFVVFTEMGTPLEWRMHACIATSLAIIIATNISSANAHHKKGGVDWAIARQWGLVIAVSSVLGSFFAATLKTAELVYIFATLAAFLAIKMLLPFESWKLGTSLPGGVFRFLNPAIIGFFSAIMGIGGGSFSVPYMTLYGMPIHRAVGTSAFIGLIISVSGGLGYLLGGLGTIGLPEGSIGFIHGPTAVLVGLVSVLTAPLGAKVAHKLPKPALSIAFGIFLVVSTLRLINAV